MRRTCEWTAYEGDEPCGDPAVDYYAWKSGKIQWLCADHFDARMTVVKMLENILGRFEPSR